MNKIYIRAIEININTNKGIFGQKIYFDSGLNIIRAENTSGKSTLLNSILYALGFEKLLSNKPGIYAIKPVLKSKGKYKNDEFVVVESFVLLEIQNNKNDIITIKRQIVGEIDCNLIQVYKGSIIIENAPVKETEKYYINREGSAQREKGFHNYLASFLDLSLPSVSRFNGGDVPLYMECIIPAFYIEQVRGWTSIMATLPKTFGIKNVINASIEYILNLDVYNIKKRKEDLSTEYNSFKEQLNLLKSEFTNIANNLGAELINYPTNIVTQIEDHLMPNLIFTNDDQKLSITQYAIMIRSKLIELKEKETEITDEIVNTELLAKLEQLEEKNLFTITKLRSINNEINTENSILKDSEKRIDSINSDIKKHLDIKRIIEFSKDDNLTILENVCPTCKQHITDVLINDIPQPMTIDDNIIFLKKQKEAIELFIKSSNTRIKKLEADKEILSNESRKIISLIRSLKNDIYSTNRLSEHMIKEKIILEESIEQIEYESNRFNDAISKLKIIIDKVNSNRKEYIKLPENYYSDNDIEKLNQFKILFSELLTAYGYRSTRPGELAISLDNYQPICSDEGFEIALDSSASDNIRIIWAYTVSLLLLSDKYNTNHWGFIVFDEPEQQRMKEASSTILYSSLSQFSGSKNQCFIATSEDKKSINKKIADISCKIFEFGDQVIKPKDEWIVNR